MAVAWWSSLTTNEFEWLTMGVGSPLVCSTVMSLASVIESSMSPVAALCRGGVVVEMTELRAGVLPFSRRLPVRREGGELNS